MSTITVYLQENLPSLGDRNRVHMAPHIEPKLVNNAIKSFGYTGNPHHIVCILDTTVFKNAKDGFMFTAKSLIFKPSFEDPIVIEYSKIQSTVYDEDAKSNQSLEVILEDDTRYLIKYVSECNLKKLSEILEQCSKGSDESPRMA